jgi:two-component system, NarL family, sensor kinase
MPGEKSAIIQIVVAGTIVFALLAIVFVAFLFLYRERHNRHLTQLKEMESQFQQELLQTQMEIQEQTFKIISQEIHDNIGQMLSLAKMNLSKFEIDRLHSDDAVLSAKDLVSKSVASLRDLSKTLNTDTISTLGLIRSIEVELELVEKTTGIKISIAVTGEPWRLLPQHELILFRIVQESLHNSIKHAAPTRLSVFGKFEPQQFSLAVTDNGTGFSPLDPRTEGSGLRNMQSRSKLIGAAWRIDSTPNGGTTMQITVPINQRL